MVTHFVCFLIGMHACMHLLAPFHAPIFEEGRVSYRVPGTSVEKTGRLSDLRKSVSPSREYLLRNIERH